MPSDDGTAAACHAKISTHSLDTVPGEPARDGYVRLERRGLPVTDEIVDRIFSKAKSSSAVLTEAEILRLVR